MARIHTKHIATMTEMREPHKVLAKSNGKPVAILKNSQVVGYFVPEEATDQIETRVASTDEVKAILKRRKKIDQPVLDYLKDK